MKTELTYLLEELYNWDDNKVITVKDLKGMINKAFKAEANDQNMIDESMNVLGPDM